MSSARALEAPRPLKSTIKQQSLPIYHQQQSFEVNSSEYFRVFILNLILPINYSFFPALSRRSHFVDGKCCSISQSRGCILRFAQQNVYQSSNARCSTGDLLERDPRSLLQRFSQCLAR